MLEAFACREDNIWTHSEHSTAYRLSANKGWFDKPDHPFFVIIPCHRIPKGSEITDITRDILAKFDDDVTRVRRKLEDHGLAVWEYPSSRAVSMPGRDPVLNWSMRIGNRYTGENISVDHATSEHRCWLNALAEIDEYLSEKA